ncbi:MAG: hypothetical protein U0P45_01325 [Acidimicrobiales bacterium]
MDDPAPPLPDGTYEVLVVDAEPADEPGAVRVEVTLIAGPHKGEVVALVATGLGGDPLDLLAAPGTVTVAGGVPRLALDD